MSEWVIGKDYEYRKREYLGYKDGKQIIKTIWTCPIYSRWHAMRFRCQDKYQQKFPTYSGVYAHEDWKSFTNFRKWAEESFITGYELDKDILVIRNKEYGPTKCAFVPKRLNYLLNSFKYGVGGSLPMGVGLTDNTVNPYRATVSIDGKQKHIGVFPTKESAHKSWQKNKALEIEIVVDWYSTQEGFRVDIADALMRRCNLLRQQYEHGIETKEI